MFITGSAVGQDLGSSNKLFGGAKITTASKTNKRPVAKHKPAAKPSSTAKKTSTPAKTPAKLNGEPSKDKAGAKPRFSEFKDTKTSKVEVTTTRPREVSTLSRAGADAIYEKLIQDGNIARDDRNYSSAEAAYKRAVGIKPRDSRAIYGLGTLYSDQQRWEDAEKSYRNALQIEPRDPVVHVALSNVLSQPVSVSDLSARYEEAEKLARRAIELAPTNALAFDQLGVVLELRGLIGAETENAYRKAI
ncbi:MAG TPA: tetratricopeptide repeat protein, partial [Pyrinomonadaceae bacterium]|nr:tetratricopeptide repeat protein [Pyrinomonadaceae bacterium]